MKRSLAPFLIAACLVTGLPTGALPQGAASPPPGVVLGSASKLPVPRFVSLKTARVNVRRGPSRSHQVSWVYTREGLPVEVVAEFENWRRVRDSEGEEGWVYHSLLSGTRTALVAPWAKEGQLKLHRRPDESSAVVAYAEPGVLTTLRRCADDWCEVRVGNVAGYMPQEHLWGVYPGEELQ
jgi:SH3-like domain-containing protein